MKSLFTILLISLLICIACKQQAGNSNPPSPALTGVLVVTGDPTTTNGARWTYKETGTPNYDLEGVLYKPAGNGPFPAILINHGTGGSALSYSNSIAKKMVGWGYVCIASNYTHSSGVACGSPGSCVEPDGEWGASNSNMQRAMKTRQVLISLGYVDSSRLAAFGHSRGAFVTTALAGKYPSQFKTFAHTAGGMNGTAAEPTIATCSNIQKPYLMHHGDNDNTVPIERDYNLRDLLNSIAVPNTLYVYPGYTHAHISNDSLMFERTKSWFALYLN